MALDGIRTSALNYAQLRELVCGMPEPIMLLDRSEKIVLANSSAETLFGAELAGVPLVRIMRWPEVLSITSAALEDRQMGEAVFQTTDSAQITYRVVVHPITLQEDETGPAVILSLRDVSHIEEAERMRSDFVANVSHELRSPLTALSGFIETLKGPASDDEEARERFLDIMEREAGRMDRLIDDLLSLSKIEVNRHIRPDEKVDLTALIRDVRDGIGHRVAKRNTVVDYELLDHPVPVLGDSDQLTQVVHNLIENAIKYAGEAPVRVEQSLLDSWPGVQGKVVRFEVIDQGSGIAPEHLPRLTERFYRVDIGRSRGAGGTGLGLAIVKHIVNRHRGRLEIQSKLSEGSRFRVILPRIAEED